MSKQIDKRIEKHLRIIGDALAREEGISWSQTTGSNPYPETEAAIRQAFQQLREEAKEEERWRCKGIVENFLLPMPDTEEQIGTNELLIEIMEDIEDHDMFPIDKKTGKYIKTQDQE